MAHESPSQGALTKAQEYGVEAYPHPLRDILIAVGMLRRAGIARTFAHAKGVALRRLHHQFVDRKLHAPLPEKPIEEIALAGLALRTVKDYEAQAAYNSGITPSKTFHWALAAIGLDLGRYHFMDIGSGWGSTIVLTPRYKFLSVTGVEFAKELHDKARANLAWAEAKGLIARGHVELRHESALETRLPDGPLLIFMFNPFRDSVMGALLDRIDQSVRDHPRSVVVVYVNPAERQAFARPGVSEIKLGGRAALFLRLFSPYRVRAYAWNPQ
jgi:hypothetical protein